jgi:predicted Rossmann fold nucleotide-binding protein DprA/Smf involved in DNA uptake
VVAEGRPRRVVSGGALGADALAKRWATEREIEYLEHPPARHCARELLARNTLIVRDSDVIVAFLSKKSRGTLDTIRKARHAKRRVVVIDIDAVANEAAASPPE